MTVYIILAGGLSDDGQLPAHVKHRIDFVKDRVNENDQVIFSALYSLNIPPVIDECGFPMSESVQMMKYYKTGLINEGCSLFLENSSFDTIGSAFYIRKIFYFLLKNKDVKVVTSDFHYKRTKIVFQLIWSLMPRLPVNSLAFVSIKTNTIEFSKRRSKEYQAIKSAQSTLSTFNNENELAEWLFTKHENYSGYQSSIKLQRGTSNELQY